MTQFSFSRNFVIRGSLVIALAVAVGTAVFLQSRPSADSLPTSSSQLGLATITTTATDGRIACSATKYDETAESLQFSRQTQSKTQTTVNPSAALTNEYATNVEKRLNALFPLPNANSVSAASTETARLLADRKAILLAQMKEDPDKALSFMQPSATRAIFETAYPGCVERYQELSGRVSVFHGHNQDQGTSFFRQVLTTDDGQKVVLRTTATFSGKNRVLLAGYRLDDNFVFTAAATEHGKIESTEIVLPKGGILTTEEAGADSPTRLLTVLVDTQQNLASVPTPELTRSMVYGTVANDFFEEDSYGHEPISGDLYGWYALPGESFGAACDTTTALQSFAKQALAALRADEPTIDPSQYTTLLIYSEKQDIGCGTTTSVPIEVPSGTIDLLVATASNSYAGRGQFVVAHELGHTLGVSHANTWPCARVSPCTPPGNKNDPNEYGNVFSVMGNQILQYSSKLLHDTAIHKAHSQRAWADDKIVEIQQNGTYDLSPIETLTSQLPISLRIAKNRTQPSLGSLFIEYRQPIGWDNAIESDSQQQNAATQGALITTERYKNDLDSYLIRHGADNHPSLKPGETFVDPGLGIKIETVAKTSEKLTVRVELLESTPPSQPIIDSAPQDGAPLSPQFSFHSQTQDKFGERERLKYGIELSHNDASNRPVPQSFDQRASTVGWNKTPYNSDEVAQLTVPIQLLPTTTYTWTVRAFGVDSGGASVIAGPFTFTTGSGDNSAPRPSLSSVTPTTVTVGQSITLTGTGFTTQNNTVQLNRDGKLVKSIERIASGDGKTLSVPKLDTTQGAYLVYIQNSAGTSVAGISLTVKAPAPTVSSVTPTIKAWEYKSSDATITVKGAGFTDTNNTVNFIADPKDKNRTKGMAYSGVNATEKGTTLTITLKKGVLAWQNSQSLPNGKYKIQVKNANGSSHIVGPELAYWKQPVITGYSAPSLLQPGTNVILGGAGFTASGNTVTLQKTKVVMGESNTIVQIADRPSANGASITFQVPSSVSAGEYDLSVSNANGESADYCNTEDRTCPNLTVTNPATGKPTINTVTPSSAITNSSVTLTGSGLTVATASLSQAGKSMYAVSGTANSDGTELKLLIPRVATRPCVVSLKGACRFYWRWTAGVRPGVYDVTVKTSLGTSNSMQLTLR